MLFTPLAHTHLYAKLNRSRQSHEAVHDSFRQRANVFKLLVIEERRLFECTIHYLLQPWLTTQCRSQFRNEIGKFAWLTCHRIDSFGSSSAVAISLRHEKTIRQIHLLPKRPCSLFHITFCFMDGPVPI